MYVCVFPIYAFIIHNSATFSDLLGLFYTHINMFIVYYAKPFSGLLLVLPYTPSYAETYKDTYSTIIKNKQKQSEEISYLILLHNCTRGKFSHLFEVSL